MTQVCEKSAFKMEVKETKQKDPQKANNVDEGLGALNSRYYERVMNLKDAKQMMHTQYHVEAKMRFF